MAAGPIWRARCACQKSHAGAQPPGGAGTAEGLRHLEKGHRWGSSRPAALAAPPASGCARISRPLLAASTSFSTRPPLASVSTDSQSLTKKKVLRAVCRSRTMTCCRNQAGLSPAEGAGLSQGRRVPVGKERGAGAGAHSNLCCRATRGSSTRCPGCAGWQSGRCPNYCGERLCPHPGAGGHSGCPPHTA